MTYYEHPYVSNSTLSSLKEELSSQDQVDKTANYSFGKLFHAFLLEPQKLDHIKYQCDGVGYFPEEFAKARAMRDAVLKDPHAALMNKVAQKEYELYVDDVSFNVDGIEFELSCRMKMDLFHPNSQSIEDYKTCNVKTHKEFVELIDLFDWDRQAAFYLTISNSERFTLRGVSKLKGHPTFPVYITRQSELFKRGLSKMNELALKYYLLKNETV